jgi:hypothetical protein
MRLKGIVLPGFCGRVGDHSWCFWAAFFDAVDGGNAGWLFPLPSPERRRPMAFQHPKYDMGDSWHRLLRRNQSLELLFGFGRRMFLRWATMLSGVVCRSWEGPICILFSSQDLPCKKGFVLCTQCNINPFPFRKKGVNAHTCDYMQLCHVLKKMEKVWILY